MNLPELIDRIKKDINQATDSIIVSVSGGSATGKSTQVIPAFIEAFGDDLVVVEQDWYQLGSDFVDSMNSPYKYDDPRNFQVAIFRSEIQKLMGDGHLTISAFNVKSPDVRVKKTITKKPVILVDGIYSSLNELSNIYDYRIYVQMPLYGRFLRRYLRSIHDHQFKNPEKIIKQVFGPVLLAHQEFVTTQKSAADVIINADYDFEKSIELYKLTPDRYNSKSGRLIWHNNSLQFYLDQSETMARLRVYYNQELYIVIDISAELGGLLEVDYGTV